MVVEEAGIEKHAYYVSRNAKNPETKSKKREIDREGKRERAKELDILSQYLTIVYIVIIL